MTARNQDTTQGKARRWIDFALRFVLGAVFIWAGGTKIGDPHDFATAISNYQLLPEPLVNSVAVWLPWVEVICGILLICGIWIDGSLLVINALLIVFTAALVANLIRGIEADCGCFSLSSNNGESNVLLVIFRDTVLLAIGLRLFYSRVRFHRDLKRAMA